MSVADQLKWALRHSRRQRLESILVILAIGLGIGVIITVLSMFISVGQQYSSIQRLDYFRTLEILGREDSLMWQQVPITLLGPEQDSLSWSGVTLEEILELQRRLPPTMHVYVEQGWLAATVLLPEEVGEDEDWYRFRGNEIYIAGTVPAYFSFKNSQLAQGNFFVEADLLGASRVLVITHRLAEELFGDGDPIGQIVPLDLHSEEAVDFTVIGVLAPPDDSDPYMALNDGRTAWMPVTVHPSYRGGPDDTTHFYQIYVGVDPGVDLASAGEVVQSEAALLWGEEAFALRSPVDDWRESIKQVQRYALLIGMLASVGLVIAVINILNLMLARVLKRTKAVGLSMALGSSRGQVFRQFMLEAVVLGLAGSVLGIALSFAFAELLKKSLGGWSGGWGSRLGLGIALGLLISLFFGVYPAYLGSRTNPVDALRTD